MFSVQQESSTSFACTGEIKKVHLPDHENTFLEQIRVHFENQQLLDVVLIADVDKTRVPAHRLVLSACSSYFSAMFTGSLREAADKEVTLHEVRGDMLQALVAFCYTGRIELRQDTVEMLLVSASLFQMDSLVTECSKYLAEQLDPSNCLGMHSFAERYNCKDLHKRAEYYTHKEFMKVCKHEEFLNLSASQLAALIASDDLNVPSEEDVFNSVLVWVNSSDLTNRKLHLRELLPLVRMRQLSPSFINNHMESTCRSNDCLDLFINALKWHRPQDKRLEMATEYKKPRNSISGTMLAIGDSPFHDKIQFESYCPLSNKWTFWNSTISQRNFFSVATIDDNLLILGGIGKSNHALNTVINMNLTTFAVTELKPMNTPRSGLCVAVLEDCIYAIGGNDGTNWLSSVERWEPVKCIWNYVSPMSSKRRSASAAVLNGCIYVVGGQKDRYTVYSTVECYNPRFNTWSVCAPMSVPRYEVGVTVSDGVLYAAGGRMGNMKLSSIVECYDPVTNKWTMIESMSMERSHLGCSFLGKCLMAVGGFYDSSVEEYDPETKKWNKKGSLKSNYDSVTICVVGKLK